MGLDDGEHVTEGWTDPVEFTEQPAGLTLPRGCPRLGEHRVIDPSAAEGRGQGTELVRRRHGAERLGESVVG
jgi:hypothetical protein